MSGIQANCPGYFESPVIIGNYCSEVDTRKQSLDDYGRLNVQQQ
jgi:hypothetical protein